MAKDRLTICPCGLYSGHWFARDIYTLNCFDWVQCVCADCVWSRACGTHASWSTAHTASRSTTAQSLTWTWTMTWLCDVLSSASPVHSESIEHSQCVCGLMYLSLSLLAHLSHDMERSAVYSVGMCGNRISVWFRFLKTRTKAKKSNPKFQFPWLFSKPNLSHTNSQYLSHLTKFQHSSRYGHCRTVNDHEIRLSVDTMR